MFNIKPNKMQLNDLNLNDGAPTPSRLRLEIKNKLANKGKSEIGESLNNYNSLREAVDNEMQYKTKVEEKKNIIKKIK